MEEWIVCKLVKKQKKNKYVNKKMSQSEPNHIEVNDSQRGIVWKQMNRLKKKKKRESFEKKNRVAWNVMSHVEGRTWTNEWCENELIVKIKTASADSVFDSRESFPVSLHGRSWSLCVLLRSDRPSTRCYASCLSWCKSMEEALNYLLVPGSTSSFGHVSVYALNAVCQESSLRSGSC